MKKLFCLSAVALTLACTQPATAASGDDAVLKTRATAMTRQLAEKVPLTETQFVKVRRLNLRMLAETQALKTSFANDPATLDQRMAELQDHYEWDMAAILWPRQMAAYEQSRASMTALSQSSNK